MFHNLTLSNFFDYLLTLQVLFTRSATQQQKKREEFSIQSVRFSSEFCLWGLVVLFFPRHPAPSAPAGVCITEKHNSVAPVQPFPERFCVMLVTTKIYSGEGIHKKRGEGVT